MGSLKELALIFLSARHFPVYYLKLILRIESLHDYVDCLLSLAYIPNLGVVDIVSIKGYHAASTRTENAKYYGKGNK